MKHNIIEIEGLKYRADKPVTDNDCRGCAFEDDIRDQRCDASVCTPLSRSDGEHVIYKLIVKEETK